MSSPTDMPIGCGAFMMFIIFGLLLGLLVIAGNWALNVDEWRRESVHRGAAEWVMDPATGKTEWRWKEGP